MIPDVCALVRRDHDDLDRALGAMVDPTTPIGELPALLDVLKLALAVHVAAEGKVFETLLEALHGPEALRMIIEQTRSAHFDQSAALDGLAAARPGSATWYTRALELRVLILDHAERAELARWTLQDHVPLPLHRALARDYATERMRVLARASPIAVARAQLSVSN
jgi:hypothetical protein